MWLSRWHCPPPPPCWCPSPSAAPGKGIGGVHRRHRSGTREVHPLSRLAAGSRQGNVLETGEGERGGSEGPSGQRRACLSRTPCNPPTGKAPKASPERKSASCAGRQAAGCLKKNRQAVGGGWRRPTWLLAGHVVRRDERPQGTFSNGCKSFIHGRFQRGGGARKTSMKRPFFYWLQQRKRGSAARF